MANTTPQEQIESLSAKIEERNVKIEDVTDRIARQEDHILKTEKKKERFLEHRSRWVRQNERDAKKIEELRKANNIPLPEKNSEGVFDSGEIVKSSKDA